MLIDRIDSDRLKHDITTVAAECAGLKRALRSTWLRPMADEQQRLARLRRKLTELHILLARTRGRWHVIAAPHGLPPGEAWDRDAWNGRIAQRVALDYALAAGAEAPTS